MGSFGFSSTTDDVLEGVDLSGKRVAVTGGSTGLGEETFTCPHALDPAARMPCGS